MKILVVSLFTVVVLTGCQTSRDTFVSTDTLPENLHAVVEQEVGDIEIVDVERDMYAGDLFYDVDYVRVDDGASGRLRVRNDGLVISKTDWDIIEEAAGAERHWRK